LVIPCQGYASSSRFGLAHSPPPASPYHLLVGLVDAVVYSDRLPPKITWTSFPKPYRSTFARYSPCESARAGKSGRVTATQMT
jgi:hypothetical protein